MTKLREPMSFENALLDIAKLIGFDGCASVLDKSESYVRKLSNPDIEREISIQKARRLDQAYMRAGGKCAPMLECYSLWIDVDAREIEASEAELLDTAGSCAKETGEAVSAIVSAITLGAGNSNALREIEEAIATLKTAAAGIKALNKRKAKR